MTRDLYCRTTESLILEERTKFYPTKIPVPHHQLRHFISTAEQNHIYYAYKHDIYVLNLRSTQRRLVATIPFEARCLAVDYGWICVGGEVNGDCAFIQIERLKRPEDSVDNGEAGQPKCFGHELTIKELGGEIVNSMKIQKLYHQDDPRHFEMVVLISNNDKSVKIYSLDRQKVLTTLEHPVPANYASLSPDSRTLVAVGDANNAYFYRRMDKDVGSETSSLSSMHRDYEWPLIGTPAVTTETGSEDFSFSVAFSPCGRLCAVSAQGGTISIFDMEYANDHADTEALENAIICAFQSSRQPVFGCVRSMAFSPDPWGLLAWAEDHGRVGIADVRQHFVRRQIMKLDPSAADISKIEIEDTTLSKYKALSIRERLKQQHLSRLQLQDRSATSGRGVDDVAANAWAEESRNRQQQRRDLLSYHHGLDLGSRERAVLDALETTMDDVQQTMTPAAESRYVQLSTSAGTVDIGLPSPSYLIRHGSSESDEDELAVQPHIIPHGLANAGEQIDYESPSGSSRAYLPRRRSSVVLSTSSSALAPPRDVSRNRFTASPSRMVVPEDEQDTDHLPPLMSTNDLTPSRNISSYQILLYNIPPSEPVIVQAVTSPHTPPSGRTVSSLSPSRYSRRERSSTDRRYEGDPGFEADLEAHLTALSARYGAATGSSSSAETSSLPTGHVANRNILRRQEDTRRRQMAHIESLERQVRRTENRVAIASSEIEALENAIVNGVNGDRHARILEARARARAAANAAQASQLDNRSRVGSTTTAILRDLERLRNGTIPRPTDARTETPRRTTELTGRVSDNDMLLARRMIMSGARSAMDRNGNWVAAAREAEAQHQQQQLVGPPGGAVNSLIEEAVREMGPGTAGVGWSPDGRFLYAGTEEGLFEYAVNIRDRMQFPSCDIR